MTCSSTPTPPPEVKARMMGRRASGSFKATKTPDKAARKSDSCVLGCCASPSVPSVPPPGASPASPPPPPPPPASGCGSATFQDVHDEGGDRGGHSSRQLLARGGIASAVVHALW
jgi:hypothetical protein